MNAWDRLVRKIQTAQDELNVRDPFFRGHGQSQWTLDCGAARRKKFNADVENRFYYNFRSLGGHLLEPHFSGWDVLLAMQHHGLPTRLLDWTENFGVALYFALEESQSRPAVWLLDPYALNKETFGTESVEYLNATFEDGYEAYFIEERSRHFGRFPADVLAIASERSVARMRSQRGVFTLHRSLQQSLEAQFPQHVRKFEIPKAAISGARSFLRMAGINRYALFPDLDGLCRQLCRDELSD